MSRGGVQLRDLLARHTAPAAEELTRPQPDGTIGCAACGHRCRIRPGKHGVCHVRFNDGGQLRVPFGYVSSLAADPIEKKPLYHAFPGTEALSFGMLGCNFHCPFCQNWVTSQTLRNAEAVVEPRLVEPEQIVDLAVGRGCRVLTSTYNEPLITSEWAVAIFRLGRQHGLTGAYVSNGHATPEVLEYLRPYVDMYKIDLKAFRERTYQRLGGVLQNVLDTIRRAKSMGFWVEIVTLVVPGLNDSDEELTEMATFIADVSPEIPWHVTAFHPSYNMTDPPRTPASTLVRAYEIGRRAGLHFVYAGNLPGQVGSTEHTYCHNCGALLIERRGFSVARNHMKGSTCPSCGERIPGIWETQSPSEDGG